MTILKFKPFLDNYNWILNRKHKILVQILDKYEESQKDNEKLIVKKICDIITLLSNDGKN